MQDINEPLLRAVGQYILQHPERLDMEEGVYVEPGCGTTACLAGTACLLYTQADVEFDITRLLPESQINKWKPEADSFISQFKEEYQEVKRIAASAEPGSMSLDDCTVQWDVTKTLASKLLGLTNREASPLFYLHREYAVYRLPRRMRSFQKRYVGADGDRDRAQIVNEFIEAYIPYIREQRKSRSANAIAASSERI